MRNEKIKTSKIKLAQMRYFDAERNGSEIPVEKCYAFLIDINEFDKLPEYFKTEIQKS